MRTRTEHIAITTNAFTLMAAAGLAFTLASSPSMAQSDPLDEPFVGSQLFSSLLVDGRAWKIDGREVNGDMGKSVSVAGDLNGDGVDDLIFGAPLVDAGGDAAGEAYVVFGRAGGPSVASVAALDGQNGFVFRGGAERDELGPVAGAGDLNGDGLADVIIGAPAADASGSQSGETYVVFGREGGFPAVMTPSDLDGTNGFRLPGVGPGDLSGLSVAGIGDINNDGVDDAIIGAQGVGTGSSRFPEAYVLFGRRDGFEPVVPLADLEGSRGFRFLPTAFQPSNPAVAGAGDVNGDGIADLIVGVTRFSTYVVFGRDGGFPDAVSAFELDGTNGFTMLGMVGDGAGWTVSSAGDLNGDGLDDIAIGAPYAGQSGDGFHYQGYAYVVFGKRDGFDAVVLLPNLNGADGFRMEGATNQDLTGASLAAVGDVNGDGFDDLAVGTPGTGYSYTCYYCGSQDANGAAYVIYGRDSGFDAVIDLNDVSADSLVRFDGWRNYMAASLAGGADVNGDNRPDIVLGAPDGFFGPGPGSGMVIYGRGVVCTADIDGDGELTIFDFLGFQNLFDAGDARADFDGDGELTLFDFLAFQNAFDAGCP